MLCNLVAACAIRGLCSAVAVRRRLREARAYNIPAHDAGRLYLRLGAGISGLIFNKIDLLAMCNEKDKFDLYATETY